MPFPRLQTAGVGLDGLGGLVPGEMSGTPVAWSNHSLPLFQQCAEAQKEGSNRREELSRGRRRHGKEDRKAQQDSSVSVLHVWGKIKSL